MIEIYAKGNYFFIEKGGKKWVEYKVHVRFDNNIKDTERYNILINDKLQTEISGNSWKNFTNEGSRFESQEAFDTFIFANTGFKSASGGSGAGSTFIEEGDNVTITGNGEEATPYIISADGGIEEVPLDGGPYGRQAEGWVEISGGELEKVTEGANTGYRIRGRDAGNYGNIGEDAVDFSLSNSASTTKGATGTRSFSFGLNNTISGLESAGIGRAIINPYIRTLIVGESFTGTSTNGFSGNNIIVSDSSFLAYNNLYGNILGGFNNSAGTSGAPISGGNVVYDSLLQGMSNALRAGIGTLMVGNGLIGGSASTAIVGVANEDITVNNARAYGERALSIENPRFIVGIGTMTNATVNTRANGFVVMSNGTVTAPSLTITLINTAGAKALVTKEYNDKQTLTSYTVATLPASPTTGDQAAVTDADAPTYLGIVTGGGTTYCPVVYNGTNWVCH